MPTEQTDDLSGSLEDYLETVFLLLQKQKIARVKDIAKARDVKAGSVSQALKRLSELGLVDYVQREYVCLTEHGEKQARRVFAKHQLLKKFFEGILQMSADAAEREACAIEHSLSAEGMERLVRFFEFLATCPDTPTDFIESFKSCPLVNADFPSRNHLLPCAACRPMPSEHRSVVELKPGDIGDVVRIVAPDTMRQRLLGLGLLPNTSVQVQRVDSSTGAVWIKVAGNEVCLQTGEADSVRVAVREQD